MGRHLLDPVGSESVGGVVAHLGAVPSMDEALAELAVRTRRTTSVPGELAQALVTGEVVSDNVNPTLVPREPEAKKKKSA